MKWEMKGTHSKIVTEPFSVPLSEEQTQEKARPKVLS